MLRELVAQPHCIHLYFSCKVAIKYIYCRRYVLRLALYYFVLVFFSPLSIAITSLREERAKLFVRLFDFRFVLRLSLYYFVLVFFSPLSIAITSLGKERANLSAFRTFVRMIMLHSLTARRDSLNDGLLLKL